jgi:hypothetical protein
MSHRFALVPALLVALAMATISSRVEAQQMQCSVHSIRASNESSTISPALEVFRNFFGRPPLSSFTAFELISTRAVTLASGRDSPLDMGHGVSGQLRLQSSSGAQRVLNLVLRHTDRTLLNTRFGVSPGHPFFVVVGSVIPEGTLVLGIICP